MKPMVAVALGAWGLATVALAGATMVTHLTPLPVGRSEREGQGSWRVTHVLSAKCPCSRRVAEALMARGVSEADSVRERVVLVDDVKAVGERLEAAGFRVLREDAGRLRAQWGVEAAPVLIVHRPDGSLAYQGAYAPKRSLPPRDVEVLAAVQRGESVAPYPLLGCAVSQALQAQTDPWGVKY